MSDLSAEEIQLQSAQRVKALNEAARRQANEEAEFVSRDAVLMGSTMLQYYDNVLSAALTPGSGRSMIDTQKFRKNFYRIKFSSACGFARIQAERNWFARPVVERSLALFGHGFRFATKEAQEWAVDPRTSLWRGDFQRIHDAAWREWWITSNVVAIWRTAREKGKLPHVEIVPVERVRLTHVFGVRSITIDYSHLRGRVPAKVKDVVGERAYAEMKKGRLEIEEGDEEWDFEVMTGGSDDAFVVPSMTAIQDDLEFLEAVKVGDWNGAWRRRITILHAKKGYGVESGTNAGTVRTHAKKKQLEAINEWLKKLDGHGNAATNFDQEFLYSLFPSDFFSDQIGAPALARMQLWGGFPAVQLLKSESQISGVSPYLMMLLRSDAAAHRGRMQWFLSRIFESGSFRGMLPSNVPALVPAWSDKLLHTIEELMKKSEMLTKSGASRRTLREAAGMNHDEESARNKAEVADPDGVIPVMEGNQGLPAAHYMEIYPGKAAGGGGEPGAGGRPTAQT